MLSTADGAAHQKFHRHQTQKDHSTQEPRNTLGPDQGPDHARRGGASPRPAA